MAKKDEWLDIECDLAEVGGIRADYVAKGWTIVGARTHYFHALWAILRFSRQVEFDGG